MRIQLVRTLQGGEKLAGPVITKENEILISEGTTLKTEYLDLISFLGIETVCIEDPYEEDETPHDIISNEKREEYIEKIKSILESIFITGAVPFGKLNTSQRTLFRMSCRRMKIW